MSQFVLATGAAAAGCSKQTVEVGIVKAIGCWTRSTGDGATIYKAALAEQPDGIDMNGLVVTGPASAVLQINTTTRVVRLVSRTGETAFAQLESRNWPRQGELFPVGLPMKLDFVAPQNSDLLLANVHLPVVALAGGFVPVGDVATPVYLHPGGTGSMDLTVLVSGIFTLKGKPQSVTIDLPTTPGQGTKLDGFQIKLEEVDAIKAFTLREFLARYSASQNLVAGLATVHMPFMGAGTGVGIGFKLENGTLTEAQVNARGVRIPIGGAGFITDLGGGFRFVGVSGADFGPYCKSLGYEGARIVGPDRGPNAFGHWKCYKGSTDASVNVGAACQHQTGNPSASARYTDPNNAHSWECVGVRPSGARSFDLSAFGNVGANFGPTLPTKCCGEIPPIRVDARLDLGLVQQLFFFKVAGGVEFFRIPVGDAFFAIHGDGAIEGGLGLGIGFPSFSNNENDPFYIGARVGGWMAKGRFQFEGRGRVSLFGLKLLDAEALTNNRAAGACWTVLGFPGGAVYQYGSNGVRDFGVGCGLGDYKEKLPAHGAAATATRPRTFRLTDAQGVLAVDGAGAAPRFTLRSGDGRVLHTPTNGLSSLTRDYAFFINDYTHTTHVVLRHPKGTWTVIPDGGSVPIANLEAAGAVPKDRVTASVQGSGRTRTVVFHGLKRPHTQLLFTELLPDGSEIPIFQTGAASGRRRFTVAPGFGKRRLRVVVIEGFGSRQSVVLARYMVRHAPKGGTPARVSASDDEDKVHVQWSAVKGAQGYLVQISTRRGRRLLTSYVRHVSRRARSIVIPQYPAGGGTSTANVYALNVDGALGNPRGGTFLTSPSARTIGAAASLSARSATRRGNGIDVRTQCPQADGDCQVRIELLVGGHTVASARYQQPPGTFHPVLVVPRSPSVRRALQRSAKGLRLVVHINHADEPRTATAGITF